MEKRETFASRLGFILISAGCAIGLGNVWRFPYITGKYGGAAFVLIYLCFLVILGIPIMVMEFSVGRASRRSAARSFHVLEPKNTRWHLLSYPAMAGNYLLMMFYTTVAGWMLAYIVKMLRGEFTGLTPDEVGGVFNNMLAQPGPMLFWMVVVVVVCFGICVMGLQKGVERITKVMMVALFFILILLCIRSVTLPGAGEGIRFYLVPDFGKIQEYGWFEVVYAAMGQSFFTLSLGIGAMAIFGSYIGRERRLFGEAINVGILDTFVAFTSGLIIFPSAFAFGVNPDQGPNLIFVTLPNVFNSMPGGRLWGALFFVFLFFAALSTVTAVFENILACWMDKWGISRGKAVAANLVLILLLSLPCLLGNNLWSGVHILGMSIMDFEDFLVSNNLLPIGSVIYLLFCCTSSKYGWGFDRFLAEVDQGQGIRFPARFRIYFTYILPVIVLVIFVMGYWDKFGG